MSEPLLAPSDVTHWKGLTSGTMVLFPVIRHQTVLVAVVVNLDNTYLTREMEDSVCV